MPTGASAEKVELFGVPIDNLTLPETVDRIEAMIEDLAASIDEVRGQRL